MKIEIRSFWPGIIMVVIATVLFCLPGNEFPKEDWFAKIFLDKWVHVGLFALLVTLWCLPLMHRLEDIKRLHRFFVLVALGFVIYGIVIEFIQGNFIPHRTFGLDDMVADAVGCIVGFLFVRGRSRIRKG